MARGSSYVRKANTAKKKAASAPKGGLKTQAADLTDKNYFVPSNYAATTPCWDPVIPDEMRWKYMVENVNSMRIAQGNRYNSMRRYFTIYEFGYRTSTTFTPSAKNSDDSVLMVGNRVFQTIRTAIADAFSQQVVPQVYTNGGTKKQRDMAEDATEGSQAILDENNFSLLEEEAFIDALAGAGTGALKIWPDFANMRVKIDRIIPTDILIDDMDGRNRQPTSVFVRYMADKSKLSSHFDMPDMEGVKLTFSERKAALENADPLFTYMQDETPLGHDNLAEVWELQHLPSRYIEQYDKSGESEHSEYTPDGMRLVCVNGATLQCMPHCKPHFDMVFYTPIPARIGFWGVPLMRFLAPIQRELEVLDMRIQRHVKKLGGVSIGVPRGAKINVRHLTNDAGTVFEFDGNQPPVPFSPTPINDQVLQYWNALEQKMTARGGQNEMSQTGQLPTGLTHVSGKALYAALDTGSRVNAYILRERERRIPEVLNLILDAVAALIDYNPNFVTRYTKGKGYKEVDWKAILEARENLMLKCKPINALSTHPTARLGQATELLSNQAISNDEWRDITRIGDVTANTDQKLAARDIIQMLIDDMLENGKYHPPESFYNLELCLEMGVQHYAYAQVQEVDEDKLDLLRRWIAETSLKLSPPAPMPGPEGLPPGGPEGMAGPAGPNFEAPPPPGEGGPPMGGPPPMLPPGGGMMQ